MQDCIFCKIVAGELPAAKLYEDDAHVAFKDIAPQAPVHLLVVPRQHSARLDEMQRAQSRESLGALFAAAVKTAEAAALTDYRVVVNVGAKAGQVVFHTHVHVLGGWTTGGDDSDVVNP